VPEKIVLTDHAWPDVEIERSIAAAAGVELISAQIASNDLTSVEQLVAKHDPVAIMTCWAQVTAVAIARPTKLKVVARLGVGLDNIAIDAATKRGAWVTNVPDYCVEEVSDHAIAMMLNYTRGISDFDRKVKGGEWNPSSAQLLRLRNLTVGIIGYGHIGKLTAQKLALGFGCRVLVNAPSLAKDSSQLPAGVTFAALSDIQRSADIIALHLPLTANTRHFVNDEFLRACQRKPYLINVSRGGLIDNEALIRALDKKLVAGAALDVVEGEPTPPKSVVERSDVVVTPHIAFTSDASLRELRQRCTEDVVRVLRGERPLHPCNDVRVSR
jgi:D-3-phosphoglycerate dehydrogenase / 2-oxoglutarate reductase